MTRIEEIVYVHQFEGGAVGAFNASLMARKLQLTDKQDITSDGARLTVTVVADTKAKQDAVNEIGED